MTEYKDDGEAIETLEVEQVPEETLTDAKVFISYVVVSLIGLVSYFADLITDIFTAYRHFQDGHPNYGLVTILLVLAPSLAFAAFAIFDTLCNTKLGLRKKLIYIPLYAICSTFLLLWPIWRYSKMVHYSVKAMNENSKRDIYVSKVKIIKNDDNAVIQIILEAFMESAPQSLFQLYLIFKNSIEQQSNYPHESTPHITTYVMIVSTVFSVISLSSVVVECQINSEHHMTMTKSEGRAYVIEYVWWFMSIGSRVVALAFFAAIFKELVFVVMLIHCITVSFCLVVSRPDQRCSYFPLMFAIGIIYIFCFVEYKVDFGQLGKTVGLYMLYYTFIFVQNVCMTFSAYYVSDDYTWKTAIMILHYVTFLVAVGLMLFYLGLLRPVLIKRAKIQVTAFLKRKKEPAEV